MTKSTLTNNTSTNVIKKSSSKKWKKAAKKKKNLNKDTTIENSIRVYYSIYRGWSVDFTACFLHPIAALVWCRWMLWKDMVLHFWNGKANPPKWHSCVGRCEVATSKLVKTVKEKGIWGELTKKLFHGVDVWEYQGKAIYNNKIIICDKECYCKCLSLFKQHADYQQSAGSIFTMSGGNNLNKMCLDLDHYNWEVIDSNYLRLCSRLPKDIFLRLLQLLGLN